MADQTASSEFNADLLQFLMKRSSYPHHPAEVRHIQTHISRLFIAPPYVYKFKKPVDFGFVDYSSLEKRREFCRREVELNRRLTEDVYLGVAGITEQNGSYSIGSADEDMQDEDVQSDRVVEYAVKMRLLSDKYFLHAYMEDDRLNEQQLDRVADRLARFYGGQEQGEELSEWGSIEKIKVNTDENFTQTERFIGHTINCNAYRAIQHYTSEYYREHETLFRRRRDEGRIVDGHGDLHLEHIYVTPEKVMIYDCIEFNDRFRYGDLAADLAFFSMDLDFNGYEPESRYFIERMAKKLSDEDLTRIINFYKCYRAYVKGKVKSLQSTGQEVPREEQTGAADLASRYFDLSLRYALTGSEKTVLIFMGRIGTGKSTLSGLLSQELNMERFSSDHLRKRSLDLPLTERTPADRRERLYSQEVSEHAYEMLWAKAADGSSSVILDATFGRKTDREKVAESLGSGDIDYVFIEARASDETIKERLRARDDQKEVISDARLEDFEKLSRAYTAPVEVEDSHIISVNTNQSVEDSVAELYIKLAERNLEVEG